MSVSPGSSSDSAANRAGGGHWSGPREVSTSSERYVLIERLAIGGMSEVFFARQLGRGGFSRLVVVKQLLPTGEDQDGHRLLDEARLAAAITHENVVTIIDVGSREDKPFVAMEYVHGVAASILWKRAMQRAELVSVVAGARIVQDAARGLHHAHCATGEDGTPLGIVHRDVAPKNILVRVDGVAKIADFGIAFARERLSHTQTGAVPGTLPYMAPEQARMQKVTARCDQFSLGVVLWEMLTGLRLFKGESQSSTLKKLLRMPILPPSSYRPGLENNIDDIVMRMLARDPSERFESMADVVAALDAALPGLSGDAGRRAVADAVAFHKPELEARERRIRAAKDEGHAVNDIDTVLCTAPPRPAFDDVTRPDARDAADGFGPMPTPPTFFKRHVASGTSSRLRRLMRSRARHVIVAGAAAVCVTAVAASAFIATRVAMRQGKLDEEALTRAFVADEQRSAAILVRAGFLADAWKAGVASSKADVVADELADITGARLDAAVAFVNKPLQQRIADRALFDQRNKRLDDDAVRVLAGMPADVSLHARQLIEQMAAVPAGWIPPGVVGDGEMGDMRGIFQEARDKGPADIEVAVRDVARRHAVAAAKTDKLVPELKQRYLQRVALYERDMLQHEDVRARLHALDADTRALVDASVPSEIRDAVYLLWHERFVWSLHDEPEPMFGPPPSDIFPGEVEVKPAAAKDVIATN